MIQGQKVLDAMELVGIAFEHPTITGASPAALAQIDQTMAKSPTSSAYRSSERVERMAAVFE